MKKTIVISIMLLLLVFCLTACGVKPEDNRLVMTLNGEKIYYDYYRYAVMNVKEDFVWQTPDYSETVENAEIISEQAVNFLLENQAKIELAEKYGIKLSSDEKKEISESKKNQIVQLGSEEEFEKLLSSSYLTEYTFEYIQKINKLWSKVYDHITSESSGIIKATDEEILLNVKSNFRCYRYIVVYNQENESIEENKQKIKEAEERLADGGDFAELIKEYGEEPSMLSNKDSGYYFTPGEISEKIEAVVNSLSENGVSDIIDMNYALFIVQRLPLDDDYISENFDDFRIKYKAGEFNRMLNEEAKNIEINYADLYKELDVFSVK